MNIPIGWSSIVGIDIQPPVINRAVQEISNEERVLELKEVQPIETDLRADPVPADHVLQVPFGELAAQGEPSTASTSSAAPFLSGGASVAGGADGEQLELSA